METPKHKGALSKLPGKLDEAIAVGRQLVAAEPDHAEAHGRLGNLLYQKGMLDEAIAAYTRAVQLQPAPAIVHYNLGLTLARCGRLDEAAAALANACRLDAKLAPAQACLGSVLGDLGQADQAIAAWQRALRLQPDDARTWDHLGGTLLAQQRFSEAADAFGRSIQLRPAAAAAHTNLGIALANSGRLGDAVGAFRRAIRLDPNGAEYHYNLGKALTDQEALGEAVACYRRALELKPDRADVCLNLGNALRDQGKLEEAITFYRRTRQLKPDFAEAHSNLLCALHYCPGVTLAALAEAHAEYDRRHAAPLRGAAARHQGRADRNRLLRLGFVSPDLARHPVGFFLVRVLENLRQEQAETICYSDRMVKHDMTHRLQAAANQWRDVKDLSDQQLAEQIRADRIDVLFDLAGHTAHNRLLVFARKPAPIQITWAGYVGTTGLKEMDYLLADRYQVPPDAERHYWERVLRMPGDYICYDPPAYAPPVAALPALARGQVTFGCFNNPAKVTGQVIEIWSRILHRLPEARLVLKYRGWNDPAVIRRFTEMFAACGIDTARVEFLGRSPHAELLAEYNRIDIALDPFPYSGGLTTCEALWMGVPVITCPMETFASRHSLSHLSNVGLPELIARDLQEYVELAIGLAGDWPRLAALRASLRDRVAASPLCDGRHFAADLMRLLHHLRDTQPEPR